jgi:hypothetical protein
MTKWIAHIKETTTRRLIVEVEAEDWESAESKARDVAFSTAADEWNTDESRQGFDIDVEEA